MNFVLQHHSFQNWNYDIRGPNNPALLEVYEEGLILILYVRLTRYYRSDLSIRNIRQDNQSHMDMNLSIRRDHDYRLKHRLYLLHRLRGIRQEWNCRLSCNDSRDFAHLEPDHLNVKIKVIYFVIKTWTYSQLAFTEAIPQLKAIILNRILKFLWDSHQKRMTSLLSDAWFLMNSEWWTIKTVFKSNNDLDLRKPIR